MPKNLVLGGLRGVGGAGLVDADPRGARRGLDGGNQRGVAAAAPRDGLEAGLSAEEVVEAASG
jgi:hypothetical protein